MSDKSWRDKTYAFPFDDGEAVCTGMTLRDYFAGQVISSGLIKDTYPEWQMKAWFGDRCGIMREEVVAKAAYKIADAMLEARK